MNSNTLGKYLRDLRKSFGYTQEYVSSHLNVIHQTYSHYETGRIIPPADSLYILAKLYHVPVENFLQMIVSPSKSGDSTISLIAQEVSDELSCFLKHINAPKYSNRFRHLSHAEKRMLYYFEQLNPKNQEKILEMLKVELKHQEGEK